jgi:acyl-CoA thioesterase-1
MTFRLGIVALLLITMPACGSGESSSDQGAAPAAARSAETPVPGAPQPAGRPRIVALGDSLTAGLGLEVGEAYPSRLQEKLDRAGLNYEVVNAGVSGDTSAGGLRRVDWALEGDVHVLIVALGGNDALRGLPVEQLRQNLAEIIERAQARNIKVILAGMEAPPNFGAAYTAGFHQVYADLAKQYNVALVPFLLDGVAGLPQMNQSDGIHPTAGGAQKVADNVWAALKPIVQPHD